MYILLDALHYVNEVHHNFFFFSGQRLFQPYLAYQTLPDK